ncbi:hypothetical protein FQR65_LT10289 [Abscondita terminalis]|nr:hypothetical protein FQR65_LT10289 [Abscondita terminalis]
MTLVFLKVLICGMFIKYGDPEPRIIGGVEVVDRSIFPFQASLRHNSRHYCGGVILKIDAVLTAAHCRYLLSDEMINTDHLLVVVGDLQLHHATVHTRMYSVRNIIAHPGYNLLTLRNDIALVYINGQFEWNDYISPIILATMKPTPKVPCVVSGWGTQHQDRNQVSDSLYYANISVIDDSYCKNYIKTYVPYHEGMFCAGHLGGGIDACKGDSGGPLICNNELVGLISWGIGCAAPRHPGVYMDISYYYKWIHSDHSSDTMRISPNLFLIFSIWLYDASLRHNSIHYCGGVILRIDAVLTAAHCRYPLSDEVININHLLVVVGDLQLHHATVHTRMYSVKSIVAHPDYNLVTLRNDIAIIYINGQFEWNDYVSPISLATMKPSPKVSCVVSGWGTQHQDRNQVSDSLYYANISVIDDSFCKNYIKTYVPYHDGMLCAGQLGGGIDTCKGDSGGPMICNNELVGLISWGIGCAAPRHPGIYMDISYYYRWINSDHSNSIGKCVNSFIIFVICFLVDFIA